jgi:dTDP-4-amino-4,6-dideoxy-D-glucose acyltransferase
VPEPGSPSETPSRPRWGFLGRDEVEAIGFASVGENVAIDSGARFYGAERISIGSNVRIDAFVILSAGAGGIVIGDHCHLSLGAALLGAARIEVGSFVNLSARTTVYSSNDDYLGHALTGPTVPERLRRVTHAPVTIADHVIVGAGSVLLPGVTIGRGAAVGALSLVKRDVAPLTIVAGSNATVVGQRRADFLELASEIDPAEIPQWG